MSCGEWPFGLGGRCGGWLGWVGLCWEFGAGVVLLVVECVLFVVGVVGVDVCLGVVFCLKWVWGFVCVFGCAFVWCGCV